MHSNRSQLSNVQSKPDNQYTSRFKTPPHKQFCPHSNKRQDKVVTHLGGVGVGVGIGVTTKKKKIIKIAVNKDLSVARRNYVSIENLQEESTRANTLANGTTVCDKKISDFQIVRDMGRGKFGYVYAAKDKSSDFLIALKKMNKKQLKENNFEEQVKRQIIIQAGLRHENVLKLYGYFWDDESVYLILEYAPGGEVFNLLKIMQRLPQDMVRKIVKQVCEGLKYLHENNVIHRDIKPENILISGDTIKIADFGWSIHTDTRRETLCGTLDYLAPQIVKGETHDNSIDVWQVGILTYQLAIGRPPFETSNYEDTYERILTQEVNFPEFISYDLRHFVRKLLQKQAKYRLTIKQVLHLPFLQL